ncbi:hypothetical protein DFH08DRAFT_936526 [Mycena albidolilacea]|uniref:Uncharacterized protein n=1 Tax=Mycena albidolilacea TaxID=1033008 RepID=A0AAD7A3C2_9AGAR|nr:hypothetical protein DFH08DRAFT_936526 [Mycena albidolilacea]
MLPTPRRPCPALSFLTFPGSDTISSVLYETPHILRPAKNIHVHISLHFPLLPLVLSTTDTYLRQIVVQQQAHLQQLQQLHRIELELELDPDLNLNSAEMSNSTEVMPSAGFKIEFNFTFAPAPFKLKSCVQPRFPVRYRYIQLNRLEKASLRLSPSSASPDPPPAPAPARHASSAHTSESAPPIGCGNVENRVSTLMPVLNI